MQEKKILMKPEADLYKRIRKLGEGSFGKVFLVRCLGDNTFCAIKQIDIKDQSEDEKKKTVNEAKILEQLKHPNIINFREVYKTKKGRLCIVMDYADGGDLNKKIEEARSQNSHFSENQILDWFTQICLALKHVHDRKIIHRDLKSSNIFLTKENTIKLGDFGIATVLTNTLQKASTIVGSPYYLSPEIIDNKPYNMKTDIWSLGVILYELCSLTQPFNANNLNYLALKIVRGEYTPLGNNVSKDLKFLVGLLLLTDPNKRPNINEILKMPVMTNRIKNFLSESMRKVEFSHTIIHKELTNQPNSASKKILITNKSKPTINPPPPSQKKPVVNTPNTYKKPVTHQPEPQKTKKLAENKDNKLKAMLSAQEKRDEEERKKKESKEKEREEERKNMKKDIEKKKLNKHINEDYKIEYMGPLKNEDVVIEKPKEEVHSTVNKTKSKTEFKKNDDYKPELDKKTRLTREQLKQMKKNVKKGKEIPVEIFLPKGANPKAIPIEANEKQQIDEVPLVQIDLESQQNKLLINDEESKDSEEKPEVKSEKNEDFIPVDEEMHEDSLTDLLEMKKKSSSQGGNIDFLMDLEKEFMEIDLQEKLKNEAKKNEKTAISEAPIIEDDLENMIEELTLLINNPDSMERDKKILETNVEELKKKVELQDDREDDPEDLEEFDEKTKVSKVPVEECNSFSFLPEKHKIESLRNLLKEVLGEADFEKAYSIIIEELKSCDLDEIDRKYGEDNYKSLFPFLPEVIIHNYLPLLFTFVIMEGKITANEANK